jgi:hypothetical protein
MVLCGQLSFMQSLQIRGQVVDSLGIKELKEEKTCVYKQEKRKRKYGEIY